MTTPVDLTRVAEYRRGHGALYAALKERRVDTVRLRWTLVALPQPGAADHRLVLAVDMSNWPRPEAACSAERLRSAERLCCHAFGRGQESTW